MCPPCRRPVTSRQRSGLWPRLWRGPVHTHRPKSQKPRNGGPVSTTQTSTAIWSGRGLARPGRADKEEHHIARSARPLLSSLSTTSRDGLFWALAHIRKTTTAALRPNDVHVPVKARTPRPVTKRWRERTQRGKATQPTSGQKFCLLAHHYDQLVSLGWRASSTSASGSRSTGPLPPGSPFPKLRSA